ncbi:N-acetyltransferase family protein [Saccharopolyspora erythraea]|uniref:GNAT family N-acetyltransferase n=1 Tax=Saccharopolyspora erythraea TaxID=1836 RepID=UPI001BA63079|nr:GNAT family N-acetyltransferase [Saccharopolyspora erythraea]QUH02126.1 N-acetyltransferase family protein [Saccharopolyspora erythraea]
MRYCHRLATRKDLAAIVDIYNHAILEKASTCDVEPVSVASRQAWFDASHPDRHPIWVGYDSHAPQTVTGYLTFDPFLNGRPGYDVTSDIAVYLHPEHRGRGQGTYLLDEAVAHAPKLGARTLAASIFASNTASLRLFQSHGFREWGRLPGVADLGGGVIHDVVFVGRPVGNSAG